MVWANRHRNLCISSHPLPPTHRDFCIASGGPRDQLPSAVEQEILPVNQSKCGIIQNVGNSPPLLFSPSPIQARSARSWQTSGSPRAVIRLSSGRQTGAEGAAAGRRHLLLPPRSSQGAIMSRARRFSLPARRCLLAQPLQPRKVEGGLAGRGRKTQTRYVIRSPLSLPVEAATASGCRCFRPAKRGKAGRQAAQPPRALGSFRRLSLPANVRDSTKEGGVKGGCRGSRATPPRAPQRRRPGSYRRQGAATWRSERRRRRWFWLHNNSGGCGVALWPPSPSPVSSLARLVIPRRLVPSLLKRSGREAAPANGAAEPIIISL